MDVKMAGTNQSCKITFGDVLKRFEKRGRNLLEVEHNVIRHIFSKASGE